MAEQPPEHILGPVADLLLEDSSDRVQGTCLDLLERLGAVVSLAEVRSDGWFEQFGQQITHFDKICQVMGDRFLAYAIILGIQVRSLTTDPRFPANTSVEFTLNDDQIQTLPLGEFRIRVVQAMVQKTSIPVEPSLPLTVADATAMVGGKNLLLAPLFGISLEQLVLASLDKKKTRALVGYISEGGFSLIELGDFIELIYGKIRRDLAGTAEEPFKLDLSAVDVAMEAFNQGDMDGVISTLETWPGLLSILLRTPVVRSLDDEQRTAIGRGLELLGAAFERRDRDAWSEELYKIGLQFIREGEVAGRLFRRLGLLLIKQDRFGEAIAMLRRALELGAPERRILAALGRSFLKRNKIIAAAALLENLAAEGIESTELNADLAEVRDKLKSAELMWDVPHVNPL
ncbi:MAG: hypothetical protein GY847_34145 [Proteobacteria bacterium]|nr:hypothetical protein [Pseudomonadota bacterium]